MEYKKFEKKSELKSFNDLKQPNHYIRKLMLLNEMKYANRKYVLMYTPYKNKHSDSVYGLELSHDSIKSICFIGRNKIEAFIKFYDYLNSEKCLCPFDRHTTCLEGFLEEHIFNKQKEIKELDVLNFDLKTLNDQLVIKLKDAYCDISLFEDELVGTYIINDITVDPYC
jgi:hypothetical protein